MADKPYRTLLDITDDVRALDDILAENGGDLSDPQIESILSQWETDLEGDLEAKLDSYAALITEWEARAEMRSVEAARLAKRAKTDAASADALRRRLQFVFESRNLRPVETPRYRIALARNGGKRPLDIHGEVPADFLQIKTEPDKEKIRAALEAGQSLPFAILMERANRISIK
jgi:hypothetical protein